MTKRLCCHYLGGCEQIEALFQDAASLPLTTIYILDPLLDYCINHFDIGDLLLFRVSIQKHPWVVNHVGLCNGDNYKAWFTNWTFYLHKVEQSMVTYVHIGGWWIESNHDKVEILSFNYLTFQGVNFVVFFNLNVDRFSSVFLNLCPSDSLQPFP
jgi:hypothetical protein